MSSLPVSNPVVNLFADEWQARQVAELAVYTLRQPGSVSTLAGDLHAHSYRPNDRTRIWVVEDSSGNVLAEQPSLYRAIHQIAR